MAKVSWGKPKIEFSALDATTGEAGAFTESIEDIIVYQSTTIEAQEGETQTAQVEGGEIFDRRVTAANYTLTFDLWDTQSAPINEEDAAVKEYAFRITPEDPKCNGYLLPRCSVAVTRTFTATDGGKIHYVCTTLKPKTGKKLEIYNAVEA